MPGGVTSSSARLATSSDSYIGKIAGSSARQIQRASSGRKFSASRAEVQRRIGRPPTVLRSAGTRVTTFACRFAAAGSATHGFG